MTAVTLIGERLAEPGQEFVYDGPAAGCADCPYREQCLNLTPGTRYRVTDVRSGAQRLPCAVHADDVVAVEVEPTAVTATVPAEGAFAGGMGSPAGTCPVVECPSHEYCMAPGADPEREYRITSVHGDAPYETCALDRDLTLVELEPRS